MLKVLSKLIDKEIFDVGEGVYQYNIVGVRRHWGGGGGQKRARPSNEYDFKRLPFSY